VWVGLTRFADRECGACTRDVFLWGSLLPPVWVVFVFSDLMGSDFSGSLADLFTGVCVRVCIREWFVCMGVFVIVVLGVAERAIRDGFCMVTIASWGVCMCPFVHGLGIIVWASAPILGTVVSVCCARCTVHCALATGQAKALGSFLCARGTRTRTRGERVVYVSSVRRRRVVVCNVIGVMSVRKIILRSAARTRRCTVTVH